MFSHHVVSRKQEGLVGGRIVVTSRDRDVVALSTLRLRTRSKARKGISRKRAKARWGGQRTQRGNLKRMVPLEGIKVAEGQRGTGAKHCQNKHLDITLIGHGTIRNYVFFSGVLIASPSGSCPPSPSGCKCQGNPNLANRKQAAANRTAQALRIPEGRVETC